MTDEFYEDIVDTKKNEDLMVEILNWFRKSYLQDINDHVFLGIEHNANKLMRYEILAGQDQEGIANSWIGMMVKKYTGLTVKGTCTKPESRLIKTHSILD